MDMAPSEARERALTLPRNMMREEMRAEPRRDGGGRRATLFIAGRAKPGTVVNISVQGAMIETDAVLALDDQVIVAFDGCTPVFASVRWVGDGRIGLHFGRELVLA